MSSFRDSEAGSSCWCVNDTLAVLWDHPPEVVGRWCCLGVALVYTALNKRFRLVVTQGEYGVTNTVSKLIVSELVPA